MVYIKLAMELLWDVPHLVRKAVFVVYRYCLSWCSSFGILVPDSKFNRANMGTTWGQQDPGMPHDGPNDIAIWGIISDMETYPHDTEITVITVTTIEQSEKLEENSN